MPFIHNDTLGDNIGKGGDSMSGDTTNHFSQDHLGTQPRGFRGNKGKKMQDKSGKHAQVIQTKGE